MDALMPLIFLIFCLLVYFTPALIAIHRKSTNKMAIEFTNLVVGWTVIGWFVAFIWACVSAVKKESGEVEEKIIPSQEEESITALERLAKLKDAGYLSADEFEIKKQKILTA